MKAFSRSVEERSDDTTGLSGRNDPHPGGMPAAQLYGQDTPSVVEKKGVRQRETIVAKRLGLAGIPAGCVMFFGGRIRWCRFAQPTGLSIEMW